MRRWRTWWIGFAVLAFAVLPVAAQSGSCSGPDNSVAPTPCSQALTPQMRARDFLERALMSADTPTAVSLASALIAEADSVAATPQAGTIGPLYGVARWGCDNGYSSRALCSGNVIYFEKDVAADYGYVVVYYVVISSGPWNVIPLDWTLGYTLVKSSGRDITISAYVSLRQPTGASRQTSYEDALRAEYNGKAWEVLQSVRAYCDQFKVDYENELRALAARLTRATPAVGGAPAVQLSVAASAAQHLSTTIPLELSTAAVSLLVVTGKVFDDRGLPIGDAEVTLPGGDVSTRTLSDGTYYISLFGTGTGLTLRRVDLTLQRATVDLSIKPTGTTPVLAIAADGVSRLSIAVSSHGIRPDSVSVSTPPLGGFERPSAVAAPLTLDKNGNGTLVYVPPSAIPDEALTDALVIGSGAASRSVPAAAVSFTVRYVDLGGVSRTSSILVKVCRPPVLLVQPSFSGIATWKRFAEEFAKAHRLDCQIVGDEAAWSASSVSLKDWAKDVATRVSDLQAVYEASGVKIGAVDVVAHSLAGLAVRSLLESASPRQDVHKLILVGTPNHGIAWLDQEVGAAVTRWLAGHTTVAAEIYEGSAFLRGLDPDGIRDRKTLYVNLAGTRPLPASSSRQGSMAALDDGVVSVASSHLNGVADKQFTGVVHAPGLLATTPALTDSPDVWSSILDLLTHDVPEVEPDALQIELRQGKLVGMSIDAQAMPWASVTRFPAPLGDSYAVRTGSKGYASIAVVHAGEVWGTLNLDAETEIVLRASSPSLVRIEVVKGRVRLHTQEIAANLEVVLDSAARSASWYTSQPDARILGIGADFVVERAEDAGFVFALSGAVIAEGSKGVGFSAEHPVDTEAGIRMRDGATEDEKLPESTWWTTGIWRQPPPFFYFPFPVMGVSLAGLVAAVIYHVRAKRRFADRSRVKASPSGRSP